VPRRASGRSRVAWCAGNDRQTSCGRGRCPPCLLSPRGHPRISPSKQTAVPASGRLRQAATTVRVSRPRTRRRPTRPGPTSGLTSGWWTSYTSDTRLIPVRSTGPGGTSSPTTIRCRRSRTRRLGRGPARARPVIRRPPGRRFRARRSPAKSHPDRRSPARLKQQGRPPEPRAARAGVLSRARARRPEPVGPEPRARRPQAARARRPRAARARRPQAARARRPQAARARRPQAARARRGRHPAGRLQAGRPRAGPLLAVRTLPERRLLR
jgi:hypothetical protein